MAYTKEQVQDWVKQLGLDTWGPTEVNWTADFHRVHVIVGDGQSAQARAAIVAASEQEIAAGTTDADDAHDFLEHLFVTDYAQED
ncbi:MAG: hypothetical protein LBT80_05455 [Lactobacillaceae bacterium]|jgi:putative NIF3 family GTP cyclohydrolase 1 type 2|nr:hypothetical protein [Lactobacillaceae bacterium]